jgi:hypothetical protein
MTSHARHAHRPAWFLAFLAAALAVAVGMLGAAPPLAASSTYTYYTASYTYDAPARLSTVHAPVAAFRASPAEPAVVSWESHVAAPPVVVAAETAGNAAGVAARPAGVADSFVSEAANSGKGTVWRAPGSSGNAGECRQVIWPHLSS